jgi:poly(glycerol-phosphate) alpha-glucosyltransferase
MATWKQKTGLPVIATPHGMLDPYIIKQQGKIKHQLGKFLFAQKGLNAVTCFHALCTNEMEDIRSYGLKQPIAIIPNGINLPNDTIVYIKTDAKKHLLYLGRLHQKKGIDLLLEALAIVKTEYPDLLQKWIIDVVGWDHEGFKKKLQKIVEKYQLQQIVTFYGGLFDDDKKRMYANADAYILPSHGEGLPMTVLEAWSYRLPVIMTPQCNIPEGFENNAAIKIETTVSSVKTGLLQLFSMTDREREQTGLRGRKLVEEHFTWDASSKKMMQLYKWILKQEEKPDFVYL